MASVESSHLVRQRWLPAVVETMAGDVETQRLGNLLNAGSVGLTIEHAPIGGFARPTAHGILTDARFGIRLDPT